MGRHRSNSCSSSSSSSSSSGSDKSKKKWKKEKKEKKDKKDKHGQKGHESATQAYGAANFISQHIPVGDHHQFASQSHSREAVPPPAYTPPSNIPPSGYRLPLTTDAHFPSQDQTRYPPVFDADGVSPVFLGSAIFQNSVHPCKINPNLQPPCRVPFGGSEYEHRGRYDLLPFTPETMEFVRTSHGRVPPGRRAVEGGYEDHGAKLYHAVAEISGVRVPGKTGEHLNGCNVAFGGAEYGVQDNYDILCWKH